MAYWLGDRWWGHLEPNMTHNYLHHQQEIIDGATIPQYGFIIFGGWSLSLMMNGGRAGHLRPVALTASIAILVLGCFHRRTDTLKQWTSVNTRWCWTLSSSSRTLQRQAKQDTCDSVLAMRQGHVGHAWRHWRDKGWDGSRHIAVYTVCCFV